MRRDIVIALFAIGAFALSLRLGHYLSGKPDELFYQQYSEIENAKEEYKSSVLAYADAITYLRENRNALSTQPAEETNRINDCVNTKLNMEKAENKLNEIKKKLKLDNPLK